MEHSVTEKFQPSSSSLARFVFIKGWRAGHAVEVASETFFIGRSRNNNLVLDDRSISRKHAVLNYVNGRFILSDLNSFKGTYVNDKKIQEMPLENGDKIRIGDIVMEFQAEMAVRGGGMGRRAILFLLLLLLIAGGIGGYFFFKRGGGPSAELLRQIESNYSMGVKAYNVDKDVESARIYWRRVLELDPGGLTTQGRNARMLLENIRGHTLNSED